MVRDHTRLPVRGQRASNRESIGRSTDPGPGGLFGPAGTGAQGVSTTLVTPDSRA